MSSTLRSIRLPRWVCDDTYQVRPMLVMKNTAARTAVVCDRKFAEPDAPNRLPDEPLPNAAPMSAPLPCCSSTNPQIALKVAP